MSPATDIALADAELTDAADRLGVVALEAGLTVATAESCTGGLVGHLITEIAGSSAYYVGGIVSYSNTVKAATLGVPESSIVTHGAVSAQVVRAMADGVRQRLGADLGIAVTGIAGPDGGTAAKPVGLTYVAVAGPCPDDVVVRRHVWDGGRSENKRRSAFSALTLAIEAAEAHSRTPPTG